MNKHRLVASSYLLMTWAGFGLIIGVSLNNFIFGTNFLFESFLGWLLAFSNKVLEVNIKKLTSAQDPKKFINSFLFWNLIRLTILLGLIFLILASSLFYGPAFIFAFLIAYFILFVYYIVAFNDKNSGKINGL